MPIVSKYSNQQVENIVDELIKVLDKHQAPLDLSIMSLGNALTHIINAKATPVQRASIVKAVTQALNDSVE